MTKTFERMHSVLAAGLLLALAFAVTSCSYFRWGERSPDEIRSMSSDQQTNNGTLFRSELER